MSRDLTPEQINALTKTLDGHAYTYPDSFCECADYLSGSYADYRDHLTELLAPVVAQMLADERERIAREIEALPEYDDDYFPLGADEIKVDAAQIARGHA